jgi:hypothetical protein
MKYYDTNHFWDRIKQRNIKKSDVDECINNHHTDYPVKDNEKCRWLVGTIGKRNLKVMVDIKNKTLVTAYWLD